MHEWGLDIVKWRGLLEDEQVDIQSTAAREVLAINSAHLSTAQIYLHPITARDDGVSCQFSSTLHSTDSLTPYNSQR
jgi:hypothetical protein